MSELEAHEAHKTRLKTAIKVILILFLLTLVYGALNHPKWMNKIANILTQSWNVIVEIRAPLTVMIIYALVLFFTFFLCREQGIHLK